MTNKTYDNLKMTALIIVPFGTMVCTIIAALGVSPSTIGVVSAIMAAVDTFLGTVIKILSDRYNKEREGEADDGE